MKAQVVLAVEVRVEGTPRVARGGRDILDARGAQTFFGDQLLGGSQQALRSPVAAVFSPEAFAGHTGDPAPRAAGFFRLPAAAAAGALNRAGAGWGLPNTDSAI